MLFKEDNKFVKDDRVKFSDKEHWLYGAKGTVKGTMDISVEVKLDDGITVITSYARVKKLKNVKK